MYFFTLDNDDDSVEIFRRFISKGSNVNEKTKSLTYPMMVAVWLGSVDMVKLLLDGGADCNVMNACCDTPLTVALADGMEDIVRLLLESKANVNHFSVEHFIKEEGSTEGSKFDCSCEK